MHKLDINQVYNGDSNLMIKNEIINVQNKHTKVPKSINEKPKVKNLIIPTITLNIPFINLYSLCFGSITTPFLIQQTF